MSWTPANPTIPGRSVGARAWTWNHGTHGVLQIQRSATTFTTASRSVRFDLTLTPPGGGAIQAQASMMLVHGDTDVDQAPAMGRRGGAPARSPNDPISGGYGDIDLGAMGGRAAIYPLHHCMAVTLGEVGTAYFSVVSIVNPHLDHVCDMCGMDDTLRRGSSRQGIANVVADKARANAARRGWN